MRGRKNIDKTKRPYQIYALLDPRDKAVRYIGISVNPEERFNGHLHDKNATAPSKRWIKELREVGLCPIMQILEVIHNCENVRAVVCERELFWINEMKNRGHSLLNVYGITRGYFIAYDPPQAASNSSLANYKPNIPARILSAPATL